jgi:hypothetical protein
MYYIHYLSSKQVQYVSTNTIQILPKLHEGQTGLGKRVEVTETFKKEQIIDFSEKGYVCQKKG